MLIGAMPPIRMALVALPLFILLSMTPRESTADARESSANGANRRPAAALVVPANKGPADGDDGLSPFALAAVIGIGLVPAFILVSRRRQHRQPN
jgi:hypothetical protein